LFEKICAFSKLLLLIEEIRNLAVSNLQASPLIFYCVVFCVALVSAPQTILPLYQPGFCALQRCPSPCPGGKAKHLVDPA
jgi:hypothetical protein